MNTFGVVSVVSALLCVTLAVMTARILMRFYGAPSENGRFASIDGLRGVLAFSVFLHHASIWYFYLRTNAWALPPSRLFVHLGQTSVELFFMITALLFIRKISGVSLGGRGWLTLFVHRLFRLGPLYLVAMTVLFVLVAWASHWKANEPLVQIFVEMLRWTVFTIGGNVDINKVQATSVAIAYVPWSLHYEVVFYLALPLLALAIGRKVPIALSLACVCMLALVSIKLPEAGRYFYGFAGGAVAAYAVQFPLLQRFARSRAGSLAVVAFVLAVIVLFDTAYQPGAMILLTIALTIVACGADLFGILTRPTAFFVGEAAYSLYLLHPLFLFVTFKIVMARSTDVRSSPLLFWSVILILTPLLVSACVMTFRCIERPGMAAGRRVDRWITRLNDRRRDDATGSLRVVP